MIYAWRRCSEPQEGCAEVGDRFLESDCVCLNCGGPLECSSNQPPAPFLPDVERLAKEFSKELTEWLGTEKMREVIARNAREGHTGPTCASGDFCDSNMAMDAAFTRAAGREIDIGAERDCDVWNKAWSLAKKNHFWFPEVTS